MNRIRLYTIIALIVSTCYSCQLKQNGVGYEKMVVLETDLGEITIKLYNETPIHSANFENLITNGVYDGITFHRVITDFMIQTGDPTTKQIPTDFDASYRLKPEFNSDLFHKRGAVAAAREGDNVNPDKLSSGTQFYIVVGKRFSETELTNLTKRRNENKKRDIYNNLVMERANEIIDEGGTPDFTLIPKEIQQIFSSVWDTTSRYSLSDFQKELYTTLGGTPHLDGDYTVFGEVVDGMDIVTKISNVSTNHNDRPLIDIRIKRSYIKNVKIK